MADLPPFSFFVEQNQPVGIFAGDPGDFRFVQNHRRRRERIRLGGGGGQRPRAVAPRTGQPGARVKNMFALHREAGAAQRAVRQRVTARGIIFAEAAIPASGSRRRLAREQAAAAGHQQKRAAIPFAQNFRHAVERKTFADRAEVKFQPPAVAADGKFFFQERPQRLGRLMFQGRGRHRKRAARGELHFSRAVEAREHRFAQAQFFAGRELRDLADLAVRAEAAQLGFQFVHQRERRLRGLRGVNFFPARDAHLKLRRHRVVVENVDFVHGWWGEATDEPR